ncbi:MAG: hypothetical protein ACTHU0_03310, partial [Kofleriaceae bacterium]
LALPAAVAVHDKLRELEATLATAARKKQGRAALPGAELARLSTEHARLAARWSACTAAQAEMRTAEELCLDALARDVDAIDLIDAAIDQRAQFRRALFWLVTALRPVRPGALLAVHSPDARAAVTTWLRLALAAAAHQGWSASVHLWNDAVPLARQPAWGPPRDLAWIEEHLAAEPAHAAVVRIVGAGADLLFGLEGGLHRFHGLAGEPCHAWVDLLEPRGELAEDEWPRVPAPSWSRAARGAPIREVVIHGADRTLVEGEELELPWRDLPARLAEAALARLLPALARPEGAEGLWAWSHPLAPAPEEAAP